MRKSNFVGSTGLSGQRPGVRDPGSGRRVPPLGDCHAGQDEGNHQAGAEHSDPAVPDQVRVLTPGRNVVQVQLRGRDIRVPDGLPEPRLGDAQFLAVQQKAALTLPAVPLPGPSAQVGVLVPPVEVILERPGPASTMRPGSSPGPAGIQFSLETRGCKADLSATLRSSTGTMSLLRAMARSSSRRQSSDATDSGVIT